jgi:hypothetical protein
MSIDMHSPQDVTFRWIQTGWLELTGPSSVCVYRCRHEIEVVLNSGAIVVALGVFSWSNYSRRMFTTLHQDGHRLTTIGCHLGVFPLERHWVEILFPQLLGEFETAVTEPLLVAEHFERGIRWHFGPLSSEAVFEWVRTFLEKGRDHLRDR